MITADKLAQFGGTDVPATQTKSNIAGGFDMDGYIEKCGFTVKQCKPWQAHPGGFIYELDQCPFNPTHTGGSAAFTTRNGKPGFRCQHEGCVGKTMKDVFTQYPVEEKPKAAQSQLLVECAADVELFHTPGDEAFASLPVDDHREIFPLKSKGCRRWLTRAFYRKFGKPPGAQAMQDALGVLEAKAQFDSPAHQVFTRIAPCTDGFYLDLCNERWNAVEVTSHGWRIVDNPPVRFRRSKGMQPLPGPVGGGSFLKLRGLINVGDEKNWILLLSWLVAAFSPHGPYPILILQGEQGSAKSTTAKLLRTIIDPSTAPARTPPREERDLLIAASNSWVVAYDNMSGIPQWLSDGLCRLATGGGSSTRELYTDTEEVILDVTRPVILNGIDHLAERPDLADRAVILNLPRIEEAARLEEKDLHAAYERDHPLILGALLTAISTALARLPGIRLSRKPRMADFATWATAAEVPLGFPEGAFMDAYTGNRSDAVQETLESDPVGAAILGWIGDEIDGYEWSGRNQDLLRQLEQKVDPGVSKGRAWPKTPRGLSSRLRRLATFLRESGIEVILPDKKGAGGARIVTVRRIASHVTATTATTATAEAVSPLNQPFGSTVASGGQSLGVAVEPRQENQPPLEPPLAIPLNGRGLSQQVAVETVVAVVCTPDPVDIRETEDAIAEVEL